jgi:hypothetical protein
MLRRLLVTVVLDDDVDSPVTLSMTADFAPVAVFELNGQSR